jgi:hypothetical protein
MTQLKEKKLTDSELDRKEYAQFEREYADWCAKYDINYIVEQQEETDND